MICSTLALVFISALLSTSLAAAIPRIASDVKPEDLSDIVGEDPVCTLARRQVTSTLLSASRDLQGVTAVGATNTVVRLAGRQALAGMQDLTTGMTQIGFTLLAGEEPTNASRDLIADGFENIRKALDAIARASPPVFLKVSRARASLTKAIFAENKLIADCGGFSPLPISTIAPTAGATTTARGRRTILLTAQSSSETTGSTTAPGEASSVSILTVTADPTISTAVVTQTVVQTITGESDAAPTSGPGDIPTGPLPTLGTDDDIPSAPAVTDVPGNVVLTLK